MGFIKFYKTRLSPIVTITAILVGIHISWWSIQQNPALVAPSQRRHHLLGFLPLEYIRPDIIGWNRTARAREALTKTQDKRQ
ncbi:unnamed protein product [Rotaria sordida]|uniref:Uncharacterized protein n=1 Tax=Rotaria sordida TaxID=392033 RepID=A0A813YC15_9BILA|nr:unnamed protein product [Rotaria sordida]CAF0840148.1 unnamed protein product [Rotaria sordida]CAF0882062.1 unnamed protein product [Rotaria sordida]CAF0987737.1 unnamed protein product [Rotaria sordida]